MASERDEKVRRKFRKLTEAFESDHYIFIDEMGSNLGLTRRYGRAAAGTRVRDEVPGNRGSNISTIGAIGVDGVRTGLSVPGAIDGETLLFFVEELLVPTLKRGDIVLMDNASIHKLDDIEDALEAAGAGLLFLPAYSPDLNPIEHAWSKVKACFLSFIEGLPPAFDNSWRREAVAKVNCLDEIQNADRHQTSTLYYEETLTCLLEIYAKHNIHERLLISPTGSKMQAVAVGIFRSLVEDVQIVYPTPRDFLNPEAYTQGIGKMHLLSLEPFSKGNVLSDS